MRSPARLIAWILVVGAIIAFTGIQLGWFGLGRAASIDTVPPSGIENPDLRPADRPDGVFRVSSDTEGVQRMALDAATDSGWESGAVRQLEVEVLDPDGQPISGVPLQLHRILSPPPNRRTEPISVAYSDDQGSCRFGAPANEDALVEVVDDRFARESLPMPLGLDRRTLRLETGFTIEGIVYSRQQAARGIEVVLEPVGLEPREARVTRTGVRGRFRFTGVSGGGVGAVRITARDGQHRPVSRTNIPVGTTERVRLEFRVEGETFSGQVVDEAGDPVQGADVRIYPSTAWNATLFHPFRTRSGDDGGFTLKGLGPGDSRMIVRHPDYSVYDRVVVVQRDSDVKVTLKPACRLSGQLDGELPANLRLKLRTSSGDVQWADVDEDGRFGFGENLSTGPADLEVIDGRVAFDESGDRLLSVELEPGSQELTLPVGEPNLVVGKVVDREGEPVSSAEVSVRANWWLNEYDPVRFYTTTDEDGRFEFRGLPGGSMGNWVSRYARSARPGRVEHPDFGQATFPLLAEGPRTDLGEIRLEPPASIRGLVSSGGRPLAGVTVYATNNETHSAVTDRSGRYGIDRLEPGSYRVFARYSTLPIQFADAPVEVGAGDSIEGLDLDFPPAERIELQVLGELDDPVAEASVFLVGAKAPPVLTDSDGRVSLDVPKAIESFEVVAPTGDLRSVYSREELRKNQNVLRLRWLPRHRVTGTVLGLEGEGPPSAILRSEPMEPVDIPEHLEQVRVDGRLVELDRGQFELFLPAGRTRLSLEVPGYLPFQTEIDPSVAGDAAIGGIRLRRGARVKGRVMGPDGEPLAGAFVRRGPIEDLLLRSVRGNAIESGLAVQTDAEGRFEIWGIARGFDSLSAVAAGCAATELELSLPDDLFEGVEIRLTSVHEIELFVPDEPGIGGSVVSIYRGDRLLDIRAADPEGRLLLLVQVPGTYRFELSGSKIEPVEVQIGDRPLSSRATAMRIDLR